MKIMTFKKAIPAALILAGSVGFASNASASAYAISYDNVFALQVTSTNAMGGGGPFYVPPTAFTGFNATSEVNASQGPLGVPVFGVGGAISGGGPVDMPVAIATGSDFTGLVAPTNNSMTQVGQGGNPAYAYADAQVGRTTLAFVDGAVVLNDVETQAWNIAEGYVDNSGFAAASTRNSSETGFTTTFEIGGDAIFNFDFNADPYLEVGISADAGAGSSANAELNVIITITDDNGGTVFSWSPDGQAGGITGGTENLDPFSLNDSLEVSSAGASLSNGVAPTGLVGGSAGFGMFSASTDTLSAGTYTISLDMSSLINVTTTAQVPNPGVLGLMGLGLAGLGFSRRRKAS